MNDRQRLLEDKYCPPIDPALFFAIISDYDLADDLSYQQLCTTLEVLKTSASAEENAVFDPSGSGEKQQRDDSASSDGSSDRRQSWHGDLESVSGRTEDTTLSQASESVVDLVDEDVRNKAVDKADMFPEARFFDIDFVLKKTGNNFRKAVEELLNQNFIEEEGYVSGEPGRQRGVEGFYEPNTLPRGRRKKGWKQQSGRRTSSTPAPLNDKTSNGITYLSRWDRAKVDVDFVTQRTFVSAAAVTSIYHRNGASLSATIATLCSSKEIENPHLANLDLDLFEARISELANDVPAIPHDQLKALVQLTYPVMASARELARALSAPLSSASRGDIIPHYLPRSPSPSSSTLFPSSRPESISSLPSVSALAASRSAAFTKAQDAYHKSRSDRMMGGAAAYYSSVGREASASLRRQEAAAADALVSRQSKVGEVDLHGVNVQDAVRIAKHKADFWWENEGREWARTGKMADASLRIITGRGQHSQGGKGKIGPAIVKMLVREGWKIQVLEGCVEIRGKARI